MNSNTTYSIDLCNIFNVNENEIFDILTKEHELKSCKIYNGELYEDIGYVKGEYYTISDITFNDVVMINYNIH